MGADGAGDTPGEGSELTGIDEARRRIAEAARTGATVLDLGGLGLTEVPEELYALGQLKRLYLGAAEGVREKSYFALTQEDKKKCNALKTLPSALLTSLPHLTHLYLERNQLGLVPPQIGALADLVTLDMSDNLISDDRAVAIASLRNLASLNLSYNHIGMDGVRAIAQLRGLTSLDLQNNLIGDSCAKVLATLVGLNALDLSRNQIGDNGAAALGKLARLTCLGLSDNLIGRDGVRFMAAQLSNLTALTLVNCPDFLGGGLF